MARKPPPKHSQFKKGQSGNPGGKPKLPEDIKKARTLNQLELERVCNRQLYMTRLELAAVARDPGSTMLELTVASILGKAMEKGDQQRIEWIAMRLIGRVQDRIEVTTPTPYVIHRSDGSTLELGAKVERES